MFCQNDSFFLTNYASDRQNSDNVSEKNNLLLAKLKIMKLNNFYLHLQVKEFVLPKWFFFPLLITLLIDKIAISRASSEGENINYIRFEDLSLAKLKMMKLNSFDLWFSKL